MLRYKTKSRPGLVALYDIRPGNGAGPFLQPRSPHGARIRGVSRNALYKCTILAYVQQPRGWIKTNYIHCIHWKLKLQVALKIVQSVWNK